MRRPRWPATVCSSVWNVSAPPRLPTVSETSDNAGPVKIVKFADDGKSLGASTIPKVQKTAAEWKAQLTGRQFDVTRRAATEWAFTGALDQEHRAGLYRCVDCDNALFDSNAKFDSGTGWPVSSSPSPKKTSPRRIHLAGIVPQRSEVRSVRRPPRPRFH